MTFFRNLTLNSIGVKRDLYTRLQDGDVEGALRMMSERDTEVDLAIKEYNPQTHDVMFRPNKSRKNDEPYITEKLPRSRQRYINEVELFFMLSNPIIWKKEEGDDECFGLFLDFIKNQHFNSRMRQAKRLAGAETESAKLYHIYRDEKSGEKKVKAVILARSTGYKLRTLIDQFGTMTAFAYGYTLNESGSNIQHWDFQTPDFLIYTKKSAIGWEIQTYPNPTGKINVLYYRQPKSWDGVEARIKREEFLDSKIGDTNNYFADPIAKATADVIDSLVDPDKPGKLIQLTTKDSAFDYVNPPLSSELRAAEKDDLHKSILFDTYTPDFDFESLKGMGTLTGAAIRNAMVLGYIKRDNRLEIYEEIVARDVSVIIAILKFLNPGKEKLLDELKISFEFAEPFLEDKQSKWQSISALYKDGLLSLEMAVTMLSLTDAPEEEIERLRKVTEREKDTDPNNNSNKGNIEPDRTLAT